MYLIETATTSVEDNPTFHSFDAAVEHAAALAEHDPTGTVRVWPESDEDHPGWDVNAAGHPSRALTSSEVLDRLETELAWSRKAA